MLYSEQVVFMELIQLYSESAIKQIYSNTLQLSICNYHSLPENIQVLYKEKYENALSLKEELGVSSFENVPDIIEFLSSVQEDTERITLENQPTIDLYATHIEQLLNNHIPDHLNSLEKLEFLFDFITSWVSYSEDAFQYCFNIPPIHGFLFDFYQGIPISTSYAGLLVTRQGLCGDIANLYEYLARNLGINLETVSCMHGKNYHTLNKITLEDGSFSYIDATAVIRGIKLKNEAFLVSKEVLNHQGDHYQLDDHPSVTLKKLNPVPYQMEHILSQLPIPPIVSIHSIDPIKKS